MVKLGVYTELSVKVNFDLAQCNAVFIQSTYPIIEVIPYELCKDQPETRQFDSTNGGTLYPDVIYTPAVLDSKYNFVRK